MFEYNAGDSILGVVAPRSNRLYFVHDPNGGKFKQLEHYHATLTTLPGKPYKHLFGGYQLLQRLSEDEAVSRLAAMTNLWA